jgi:hypothetical protein
MTEPPIPFETIPLDVFVHHFDIFYFVFLLRAERSSLKLLLLRTPIFSLTVRFRFLIFIPTINRAMHCFCRSHSLVHPVRFHPNAFWLVWEHWLVGGIGWIPAALLLLEISSGSMHPSLRYSFLKFYILRRAGSLPGAATF